jgi:hypothetical protein
MRPRSRRRRAAVAIVVLAAVALLVAIFRQAIASAIVAEAADLVTGMHVSFATLRLGTDRTTLTGVRITSASGAPIASIARVDVRYSLSDAIGGRNRKYGLRSIDLTRPMLTIVRYPNGSLNVPIPKPSTGKPSGPPLFFTARVRDGSVSFEDQTRVLPAARRFLFIAIYANADVDSAATTRYAVSVDYDVGRASYPLHAAGTMEKSHGLMLQRFWAPRIPIAQLVDYVANNRAVRVRSGELDGFDVHLFAFGGSGTAAHFHATGSVRLEDGLIDVAGFAKPLAGLHGRFDVTDDAVTTPSITGSIGRPVARVSGGIYDLRHPQAHFALDLPAQLATLRRLSPLAARLPATGPVDVRALVEGPVFAPEAFVAISSPRFLYNGIALTRTRALIAASPNEVDVLRMRTHYGAIDLGSEGIVALKPQRLAMLALGSAPASSLPFVSGFVPGMTLQAALLATAGNLKEIQTRGVITGASRVQSALGLFSVASPGTGIVGPIFAGNGAGSVYARIELNHPRTQTLALVDARSFHVSSAPRVPLGNFHISPIPKFGGTIDATIAGTQRGSGFGAFGQAMLANAHIASLRVAHARAAFAGSVGDLDVPSFSASGGWGRIAGAASVATLPHRMIAQLRDARLIARDGTPIARLDATAGIGGGALDIYAARARIAGGEALASGSFGNGGTLAFSLGGVDAASLGRFGLPVQSGDIGAAAVAGGTPQNPSVRAAIVLAAAQVKHIATGGAASLALAQRRLAIRGGTLTVGPAVMEAGGTLSGVGASISPNGVRYDLAAQIDDLDLQQSAAILNPRLAQQVTGSADGTFSVTGMGRTPAIAGSVDVPEGSVHGEAFRNLRFGLHGSLSSMTLDSGRVTLGTTTLAFDAAFTRGSAALSVHAPYVDLADFNDFFDTGDTFEGRGRLDVAFASGGGMSTSGSARFAGTHFRQFDLGSASANWRTVGSTLRLTAATRSSTGRFALRGSVGLPATLGATNPQRSLSQTDLDLVASARRVALASWLPLFGLTAPITGTARADASVRGRYPDLSIVASAAVSRATAGRMPIRSVAVEGSVNGTHGTIRRVALAMPYLSAAGSGSFGLSRSARFDFTARATSPNIGALAALAMKRKLSLSGNADATLRLSGTMARPAAGARFVVNALRLAKLQIPRLAGTLSANRRSIALRNGEVDLRTGRVLAAARIPLPAKAPMSLAAVDPPIFARIRADDVTLSNFSSLLPSGSTLDGRIDGSLVARGTTAAPELNGTMRLTGGSYSGSFDKATLDGIGGQLAFSGTTIALRDFRADVGGGTMRGSGSIALKNVRNPASATARFTLSAAGARVNSPQYFNGQIDSRVDVAYAPGQPIRVGGNVTVSHARIPVSALYHPSPKSKPAPKLPDVAFENFGIAVGPDVRIQNSSVDVGGSGELSLNGTLAKPSLAGEFASTGGTLNFYQLFRVEYATVTFDPSSGIMPYVDAVAATSIADPPTDVTIRVSGPATNMDLALSSDPSYDRSQILGLLVGMQSFGAVEGVPSSNSSPFTAQSAFRRVGFGEANRVFTNSILQPVSTALGGALGTSNLQLYSNIGTGYGTGLGAALAKRIGQHVTMSASANIGYPQQEMLRFLYLRKNWSAVSLRLYQQLQTFLNSTPPGLQQTPGALNLQPSDEIVGTASSGFILSYERKYWSCGFFHFCVTCSGPRC